MMSCEGILVLVKCRMDQWSQGTTRYFYRLSKEYKEHPYIFDLHLEAMMAGKSHFLRFSH
jgi:hypothetical protein